MNSFMKVMLTSLVVVVIGCIAFGSHNEDKKIGGHVPDSILPEPVNTQIDNQAGDFAQKKNTIENTDMARNTVPEARTQNNKLNEQHLREEDAEPSKMEEFTKKRQEDMEIITDSEAPVKERIQAAGSAIKDGAQELKEAVKEGVNTIKDVVEDKYEIVQEGVQNLREAAQDKYEEIVEK